MEVTGERPRPFRTCKAGLRFTPGQDRASRTIGSASEAFGAEGRHYGNQEALIEALRPDLAGDVVLLVKGSRSSLMERVIEALSKES